MALTPWEVWAQGILDGIGAPVDGVNVDTLWAWSGAESLPRDRMSWCNPLDTTEPWPGAVPMNSVGVRRYLTVQDGISATVMTLKNGHYPAIIANLRNSIPRASWGNACANLGTWGTGCGWLSADYGPPPTNLGDDNMTDLQAAQLLEIWTDIRLGTYKASPNWLRDELLAITAKVDALPAATGDTADVAALTAQVAGLAIQVGSMAATLAKIENALKAA